MFKNQLQELAQRSCFNLPSYACVREGPDHAPRFKASVNFNGEVFEGPTYSTTLRQAEHAAAEVALNSLSARGPSKSLTARVLDETGVYKNLLQETAHRAGLKLPVYTTVRSGPGHVPVFTSTVELAGMSFSGEAAKTKKQAEKNAAIAAWSSLKQVPNFGPLWEQQEEVVNGGGKWSNSSNAGRVIRRRDQQLQHQPRARMQRPNQSSFAQKRPWKYPDPFLDESKHKSFLSLLPPPPPRMASKILPPSWPKDSKTTVPPAVKLTGSSQESLPRPQRNDDHDNEWIDKISEAIKKETIIIKKAPTITSSSSSCSQFGGKQGIHSEFGAESGSIHDLPKASECAMPPVMKIPSTCHNQMGLMSRFSGAQRFAPAVQIRSVIPVCASPPVRLNPTNQSLPLKLKEDPSSDLASSLGKLKMSSDIQQQQ